VTGTGKTGAGGLAGGCHDPEAGGDGPDGIGQLAGRGGPAHAGVVGRGGVGAGVLGQQQDPGRRLFLSDQADQLGDGRAGQLGVDHQHVGAVGPDRLEGGGAVAGEGDDLEVVLGRQDHAQALDKGVLVVG
jgi:hypothetical protein